MAIKEDCARTLLDAVPDFVSSRFFGTGDRVRMQMEIGEMLDVLGDSYMNKHLVYAIVELMVVRLFPEMAEKGVTELMEERLG